MIAFRSAWRSRPSTTATGIRARATIRAAFGSKTIDGPALPERRQREARVHPRPLDPEPIEERFRRAERSSRLDVRARDASAAGDDEEAMRRRDHLQLCR